ncbi:MAG: bis-aminopropyl spermidine synthase family protein [Candidatus Kariarchaeaceae archaeon]
MQLEIPENEFDQFKSIIASRKAEEPLLEQRYVTEETAMRRAVIMNEKGDLNDKRVIYLGDADLNSVAAILISTTKETVVADIDPRISEYLFEAYMSTQKQVRWVVHDMRVRMIGVLKNQFETVYVEPPKTKIALDLFLGRAVQCSRDDVPSVIYLSTKEGKHYSSEEIHELFRTLKLSVTDHWVDFNEYQDDGEKTDLYRLKVSEESEPIYPSHFLDALYSYEINQEVKEYLCKCQRIIKVGKNEHFKTLKQLEEEGCLDCSWKEVFRFISKVPINQALE